MQLIKKLKSISNRYDEDSSLRKFQYLKNLSEKKLALNKSLISYYEVLLFICAYPNNSKLLALAEKELNRISASLKKSKHRYLSVFENTGLPFTYFKSVFTHDCAAWLIRHPHVAINNYFLDESEIDLNDVLKLTLPSLEVSETTRGLENDELIVSLRLNEKDILTFLINEFSKLNHLPFIKDHLFDSLRIKLNIQLKDKLLSKAFNRINNKQHYFHSEILKHFDHKILIQTPVPAAVKLKKGEIEKLVMVIKNTMLLTDRETDPNTYMDENSLRFYELERGISISIYGMIAPRQMPLESYVGYTVFKNGFPAAYGGGWVFGERSEFGINIFEPFRGGESGYIMCQLLRLYKHVFGVNYFEVEPYQFGLDNPEGIESGAYWFYYRYGFRSLDKTLNKIATDEQRKIKNKHGYRTNYKTLELFTDSPVALKLSKQIPIKVGNVTEKITRMMALDFKGNRVEAVKNCILKFKSLSGLKSDINVDELKVLEDMALWATVEKIKDKKRLKLMSDMIKVKPIDLYRYQALLIKYFKK